MNPIALSECIYLLHMYGPAERVASWTQASECYRSAGPEFPGGVTYKSQGSVALLAMTNGRRVLDTSLARVLIPILDSMIERKDAGPPHMRHVFMESSVVDDLDPRVLQQVKERAHKFATMCCANTDDPQTRIDGLAMVAWAESLGSPSESVATKERKPSATKVSTRSRTKRKK